MLVSTIAQAEQLKTAARKIAEEFKASPQSWTKRVWATDSKKQQVAVTSPEASCWCLLGAFRREIPKIYDANYEGVTIKRLIDNYFPESLGIVGWNDRPERTIEEVIAKLEEIANDE